jgi:hypothetical protein
MLAAAITGSNTTALRCFKDRDEVAANEDTVEQGRKRARGEQLTHHRVAAQP